MLFNIYANSAIAENTPGTKPKYGHEITLLSNSHDYIQNHTAPIYWAISPYYIAQQNDSSCSIATATMIVNAIRGYKTLSATKPLATQADTC